MTTFIAESLAGTGKRYLLAQVRERDGKMHVQLLAPGMAGCNRLYGMSFDVGLSATAEQAIAGSLVKAKSQAGTSPIYALAQVNVRPTDILHFQVLGSEVNREYGASFNVGVSTEIADSIASLLD